MSRNNILIVAAFALAMTSCGGNKNESAVSVDEVSPDSIEAVAEVVEAADSLEAPAEEPSEAPTIMLTKDGLCSLKLGMKKGDVPASIPGLYDAKTYEKFNHDEDMDLPLNLHGWMSFSLKGKHQFAITFDNNGKAVQISVQSPTIPTSLGITTASPVAKVKELPGVKPMKNEMLDGYEVSDFIIYATDEITSIAIGEEY